MPDQRRTEPQDTSPAHDLGPPREPARVRRPYQPPTLTEYGSVARLTRTGGSTFSEFGVPRMRKRCL